MLLITDELLRKRGWIMDNNLNYDEKFYRLPKRLFTEEQFQNMNELSATYLADGYLSATLFQCQTDG